MVSYFNLTLDEHRKKDIATVLSFFLWLARRPDINLSEHEPTLKDVIELQHRLNETPVGKILKISVEELLVIYTAAQYLQKAMNNEAGAEYISDTMGHTHNFDWFEKQKKYFINTSLQVIKECQVKSEELPDSAKERMTMEEQRNPFLK